MLGMTQKTTVDIAGPYDLSAVATMSFGHRDESSFDGAMRMAFCLDGAYARSVGVVARQDGDRIELTAESDGKKLTRSEMERVRRQVARVISLDHDGAAFDRLCRADPALDQVHQRSPGFRPALFYSPYEAAVWSVISARRARAQGIRLRARLAEEHGTAFSLAGKKVYAVPTPEALLAMDSLAGLPADRVPRLHAIAEAAGRGELEADRLRELLPEEAMAELQRLPGIGPFYSALIVIRACGHADALSETEGHSRSAAQAAYGIDHELSDDEFTELAEGWRPFRTWVAVMLRALN
jgi:DNA-3-methyladenine glycosylase II